jgi:hypothetical protein
MLVGLGDLASLPFSWLARWFGALLQAGLAHRTAGLHDGPW